MPLPELLEISAPGTLDRVPCRPMRDHELIETPLHTRLQALGIAATICRHPPMKTVDDSKALRGDLPGVHVKNLFLRDKKRQMWLVTVHEDRTVDLKTLRHTLGASGGLSFGSAALLLDCLGVAPGAVTPLAVLNDPEARVRAVLDRAILEGPVLNVHPLHNEATMAMAPGDLLRFFAACNHDPVVLDFDQL